jgi:hypothetical protein
MLRPFLPFRAKPRKKAMTPKAYVLDQRTDLNVDDVLVTVKASRRAVKFARPQVTRGLRILSRNGAARD